MNHVKKAKHTLVFICFLHFSVSSFILNQTEESMDCVEEARLDLSKVLVENGYDLCDARLLGRGRYSDVCEGIQINSHMKVAIKVVDKRKVPHVYRSKFLPREISCWRRLRHINIVTLIAVIESRHFVVMVMELSEKGDLLTWVQKNGPQSEKVAATWMKQVMSAVCYMHTHSIAHRDLKMENALLFTNDKVKIADFGFTRRATVNDLSFSFCGSKSYSAPEILLGDAYSPFKADIWAIGVMTFVAITNRMPFSERNVTNEQLVRSQFHRKYRQCYPNELSISSDCRDAIDILLTFNYARRPNIREAMSIPWFSRSERVEMKAPNR
ncbi:hypothetical protein AB6A40_003164 [Gnathostoma spinigerum]|uniref:Protein kinase domain-containing protein n=1 Tax=Gnathostoma spinigerum TaxID=75299 RepID=A0ABD6EJJ8_9BILA